MLNFVFSSELLGVRREHFQVLYKDPSRRNLFHQIREVDKIKFIEMTVLGTIVRSEVCNAGRFCLES